MIYRTYLLEKQFFSKNILVTKQPFNYLAHYYYKSLDFCCTVITVRSILRDNTHTNNNNDVAITDDDAYIPDASVGEEIKDCVELCNALYSTQQQRLDDTYGFDYGVNFSWDVIQQSIPYSKYDASKWLTDQLQDCKEDKNYLPTWDDGTRYNINTCQPDQKDVIAFSLKVIQEFISARKRNEWLPSRRLTVTGGAGSGKSTTINTLVTMLRRAFGYKTSVHVFAPTGSAAFNAGGETIHRGIRYPQKIVDSVVPPKVSDHLLRKFCRTLVIVVDERSLLDAIMLGMMESYCSIAE